MTESKQALLLDPLADLDATFPSGVLNLIKAYLAPTICQGKFQATAAAGGACCSIALSNDFELVHAAIAGSIQRAHAVCTYRASSLELVSTWEIAPPSSSILEGMVLRGDGRVLIKWTSWNIDDTKGVVLVTTVSTFDRVGGTKVAEWAAEGRWMAIDPLSGRLLLARHTHVREYSEDGKLESEWKVSRDNGWLAASSGDASTGIFSSGHTVALAFAADGALFVSVGTGGGHVQRRSADKERRVLQELDLAAAAAAAAAAAESTGESPAACDPEHLQCVGEDLLLACVKDRVHVLSQRDGRELCRVGQPVGGPWRARNGELYRASAAAADPFGRVFVIDDSQRVVMFV